MKGAAFRIWALALVFIGIICFPAVNALTGLIKDSENLENRRMASRPGFDIHLLDPFPAEYENYYDDHFTLRFRMMRYFNLYKILVFKKSPFPDLVTIGKNGWLFMDMGIYQGTNRFSKEELEDLRLELERRQDYLAKLGCKFYFMVGPVKPTIYKEQIPYGFYRYTSKSSGQQLIDYLREKNSVPTINMYEEFQKLLQQRKGLDLYYKLDSHWNDIGAFHAMNSFLELAARDFPGIGPANLDHFNIKSSPRKDGNCERMLGYSGLFTDTQYDLIPKGGWKADWQANPNYPFMARNQPIAIYTKRVKESDGPKLLLSGDSFCEWAYPFVAEKFGTTIRHFDQWRYDLCEELIEYEKPDAYLLVIHEQQLFKLLKKNRSKPRGR